MTLRRRANSRRNLIGTGRRDAGTTALPLVSDLHVRVLSISGQLLRDLQLDPPGTTNHRPGN